MKINIPGGVWTDVLNATGYPVGSTLAVTRYTKHPMTSKLTGNMPEGAVDGVNVRLNRIGIVPSTAAGC